VARPTDETLLHRLERLEALTVAGIDGIGISQDGKIVEANEQLAKLLRCDRQSLIGIEVMSFVAPESRERVARAIRSSDPEPYDHLAVRKDGSLFTVEARGNTVLYRGREARVTALRDVSEQRRLADAVRSIVQATVVVGEEFFAALVRGVANVLGTRYALLGELIDSPDAAANAASRLRVRSVAFWARGHLLDPFECSLANTALQSLLDDLACSHHGNVRERFPEDLILKRFPGDSWLGIALVGARGSPIGVLSTWRDGPVEDVELARSILTLFSGRAAAELGRRQSDQALRESEGSLRATIDATPHVAIQWYDADGRTLLWNGASERIFGWNCGEALGRTLDELILDANQSAVFKGRFAETLRTAQPVGPVEYAFRRRDGTEGRCLSTLFRIPAVDGHARVACIDVDISDWRQAEEQRTAIERQLRHAQQLEVIGTFTGGIAHDFNNILMAIFAYNELALLDVHDPEKARQHLSDLQTAALRARDLIRQILTFSRRHAAAHRPMLLQQVIREALTFARSTLPSSIQITSSIDDSAPAVRASSIQMHQVILNLCMNAAQAMKDGSGVIRVSLAPARLDASTTPGLEPGRYLEIEVSDDGSGMDEETLPHIFEPFFTTKAGDEGTGLGLTVIQGIIRDHGGAIRVSSTPGQGTSFRVYLPAHTGTPATSDEEGAVARPGNGERLLVVDDEPPLCVAYASVLERSGYRVTTHTDPRNALEDFARDPWQFDLVVTDLTMPHLTGMVLAGHLLAIRPGLPILLVSGQRDALAPHELTALGFRGFLPKPFLPTALVDAVHRALNPTA
jgi:PAS domain S-box-containing protein